MAKKGKIHIGTSGWHYKHWKGKFYPKDIKSEELLSYYRQYFSTVEINNSFYKLPGKEIFKQWKQSVPKNFTFAVKANRYITHMKKLKDPIQPFQNLIQSAGALEENLGPILFQLPPGWKYNEERLKAYVDMLPSEYRYSFEFRNDTWYNDSAYDILKEKNVSFCIYELEYHTSPIITTADYVYIRLHGPGKKYEGSYNDDKLNEWANRCHKWAQEGKDVYIYFDNDQKGYAAFNAKTLSALLNS